MNSVDKNRKEKAAAAGLGLILVAAAFAIAIGPAGPQAATAQQTESQQNQTQSGNATTIANTTTTDTFKAKGVITGTIQQGGGQQTSTAGNASQSGNPTANATQTAQSSSSPYLVGGDWSLDIESGNVTSFMANFTMVRTDGSDHHNHDITNFKVGNNTQFQLNPEGKSTINGTADIAVNGTDRWPGVDTVITIDNARILTIEPQEEEAKQHFMDQPIYGIVLQATGENGTAIAESAPAGGNQTEEEGGILDPLTDPLEDFFS